MALAMGRPKHPKTGVYRLRKRVPDDCVTLLFRAVSHWSEPWSMTQALSVRFQRNRKGGCLARQLMDKGANSFAGVEFGYTQKDAKYDALRGDAVRDALRNANSYVNGLGIKLGRVLQIAAQTLYRDPAGMSPRMLGAIQREAATVVPVEPGSEVLRTEVRVTWELAQ